MMRVQDLKHGDWVQFMGLNRQSQYGKVKEICKDLGAKSYFTDLVLPNKQIYRLTDNDDFVVVKPPFRQKVDTSVMCDGVHKPKHYQGKDGSDVITFLYQQLTAEQFQGFMIGNMIKYATRAGRKGNVVEDLKKNKEYADRLIKELEE